MSSRSSSSRRCEGACRRTSTAVTAEYTYGERIRAGGARVSWHVVPWLLQATRSLPARVVRKPLCHPAHEPTNQHIQGNNPKHHTSENRKPHRTADMILEIL